MLLDRSGQNKGQLPLQCIFSAERSLVICFRQSELCCKCLEWC